MIVGVLFGKIAIYDLLLVPLNDLLFGIVIYNIFFFLIPMLLYYKGYFSEEKI